MPRQKEFLEKTTRQGQIKDQSRRYAKETRSKRPHFNAPTKTRLLPAVCGRRGRQGRHRTQTQANQARRDAGTETTAPTLPVPGCTRMSRLSRKSRSCHPLYCSFYHNLFYFLFFQQYPVFFIVFAILSSFFPSFSLKRHFHPPDSPFSGMRFNFFWENIDKPSENS